MLVAICEDTMSDMETILDLCDRFAQSAGYAMETLPYGSAEKLLGDPKAREADVLLLDIMMPGPRGPRPAGVEVARTLRAEGFAGAIVFTTTSTDYYPEGFEVAAIHYLHKPIAYADFAEALQRAMRMMKDPDRIITVPVDRVQVTISQHLIRYVEVYGRECILHTTGDHIRVLLPLKKIESLLTEGPFLKCYRSYIINMDYVASMDEDSFILTGGVHIPISLRNRQALKERYFTYRLSHVRQERP